MFLSGGVDSSTLTAVAQRRSGGRFKTFSVGFEESSFDESRGAREVAERLGSQHYSETLRGPDVLPLLADLLKGLDEPLADPAIIPTFLLSRLARREVTVVLAGEGADELFGGYPTYLAHQLAPLAAHLGPLTRVARAALAHIPASTRYMSWEFKAKRFLDHVDREELGGSLRHQLWMGAAEPGLRAGLYTPEVQEKLGDRDGFESLRRLRADLGPRGWSRFAWQDLQFYLAEGLLVKLDRATMATSLEGRVPYLDHTLVEFALSIPPSLKFRGLQDKWLLRCLAARELGPGVAWRRKKGFGLPLTGWLKNELQGALRSGLEFLGGTGLFRREVLSRLIEEHNSGRRDRRKELWSLFMLSQWWQRWKPSLPR
jgi:asparagine synthase (glutamine-hydrolysing)